MVYCRGDGLTFSFKLIVHTNKKFSFIVPLFQVYKVGVTHYFCMDKAKHELGYAPQKKSLEGVVMWFKERGHGRRKPAAVLRKNSNSIHILRLLSLLAATAVALLALSVFPFVVGSV